MKNLDMHDNEVTLEHCSVLQERLASILAEAYPSESDINEIVLNHFDPRIIREHLLELFTREALLSMFQTEMGKGVIMGAFIQKYVFGEGEE